MLLDMKIEELDPEGRNEKDQEGNEKDQEGNGIKVDRERAVLFYLTFMKQLVLLFLSLILILSSKSLLSSFVILSISMKESLSSVL